MGRILTICRIGDPVLRKEAKPVAKVSQPVKSLLADMAATMYAAPGVGLAAPQVGVGKRIIVVDIGEGLLELVNPEIVGQAGRETGTEGCLSVPSLVGEVTRAQEVVVRALDGKGHRVEIRASGFLARALQHEIDHLNGILFLDRAENVREISVENGSGEEGEQQ